MPAPPPPLPQARELGGAAAVIQATASDTTAAPGAKGLPAALQLRRRYDAASAAARAMESKLRPAAARLRAEAEGAEWEAAVAAHRARSLVQHSHIAGLVEAASLAASASASEAVGGAREGDSLPQADDAGSASATAGSGGGGRRAAAAAALRHAQAAAACHMLESELAGAALRIRALR